MNASNGCLVASLATDDMDFKSRVAEQLQAFKVGINRPRSRGDWSRFGGMGEFNAPSSVETCSCRQSRTARTARTSGCSATSRTTRSQPVTRAATEPQVSRRPNRIQGEQTPRRGPAPRDEGVQVATTTPSSRFSQVGEPSVGLSRLSCWRALRDGRATQPGDREG